MDYLYEHEINSNKGSLKTRRKQSVRIGEEEKGEKRIMREDAKEKRERKKREKKRKIE